MTTAAPDPSSSVVVSNPQTGAHETIRWADLSAALAQGYSVPTDEEVAYEKRKASVDSTADTIAAGLESAVDWGIPFGKTLREEALGPEYIERSKAREEFHPVARGIGGALGMGAMLLGTMGVGTGAKGAAVAAETAPELAGLGTNIATGLTAEGLAAGIPAAAADGLIAGAKIATAGTAARIGQIGAETTSALDAAAETSGITGLTNHIAVNALRDFSAPARALSAVGQGIGGIGGIATEGALWGASAEAGQLTEQGQWDNPDLVAERLVHGLWTGALLGAGLGTAGKVVSVGVNKALGAGRKLSELIPMGDSMNEWIVNAQARGMELTEQDAEKIAATRRLAASAEDRAYVSRPPTSVLKEAEKTITDFTETVNDAQQTLRKSMFRSTEDEAGIVLGGKEFTMIHKVAPPNMPETLRAVSELLQKNVGEIEELMTSTGQLGGLKLERRLGKALDGSVSRTYKLLEEIQEGGKGMLRSDGGKLFNEIDSAKRLLQGYAYSGKAEPGAVLLMQKVADRYQTLLENPALWGKAAAAAQSEFNRAVTDYIGMSQQFQSFYLRETGLPSKVNTAWRDWGTDNNAVQNIVNSWLSPMSSNVNAFKVATGYSEAFKRVLKVVKEHYEPAMQHDPALAKMVDEMIPRLEKWRPAIEGLKDKLNLYGVVQQAKTTAPTILERAVRWGPAAVGGMVGGMPGAAGGAALGNAAAASIHDPMAIYTTLAKLQRFTQGVGKPALTSIAGVTRGLVGGAKNLLNAATLPIATRVIALAHNTKPLRDNMRRYDPTQAVQGISQHLAAVAPYDQDLHSRASGVAAKVYAHLYAALPQTDKPSGLTPMLQEIREKPEDTRKWAKVLDVLDNPAKLSHYLANGTVIPEQMTAIQECYPATWALMQQQVLHEASLASKPVPFAHRTSLGLVLGTTDIGSNYDPQAVRQAQSVYQAAAPQKSVLNATKARSEGISPGEGAGKLDQA